MKLLLDHCLDWRLSRALSEHTVKHVGKLGWGQLKNGDLLTKAQGQFDVFVTSDKNLPFQQNLQKFNPAIVVLDVPTNKIEDCLPKMPLLLRRIPHLRKGTATVL